MNVNAFYWKSFRYIFSSKAATLSSSVRIFCKRPPSNISHCVIGIVWTAAKETTLFFLVCCRPRRADEHTFCSSIRKSLELKFDALSESLCCQDQVSLSKSNKTKEYMESLRLKLEIKNLAPSLKTKYRRHLNYLTNMCRLFLIGYNSSRYDLPSKF